MQIRALRMYVLPFLALVHAWGATGCGNATSAADDTPLHQHVFCVARADGESMTADCPQQLASFNTWVKEAISRPYSSFSLWAIGADRSHSRLFFAVCVPPQWHAPVWQAKAEFIKRARQGVSGTQTGQTAPEPCRFSDASQSPDVHQFTVSPAAAPLDHTVWPKVASASTEQPHHLAIVCDASASTLELACNTATLLSAFDVWVAESLLRPGSSLSVEVVGASRDTMRTLFHLSVPEHSVGDRIAYILGARAELVHLTSGPFAENASAIVEAIHAAVSTLRERRGRYRLVVLSDLRQLTPEWDFETTIPQPAAFITWLKKAHLVADLRDISTLACGLHTRRSPGRGLHTATREAQLQELWQQTFRAMGATEVRLFSSCEAGFAAS